MLAHQAFSASLDNATPTPLEPSRSPRPMTASEAVAALSAGHEQFRKWVSRLHHPSDEPESQAFRPATMVRALFPEDHVPQQEPFAVAVGCADARVPVRMLFGSVVNDLFEVRVAGQVLADECLGSIEYALHHLPSVKAIVVLGHSECGAVRAAVDNYLDPCCLKSDEMSIGLRSMLNHMLGAVLQSDRALQQAAVARGEQLSPEMYQRCLLEAAVFVNAATIAHRISFLTSQQGRDDMKVVYGVYDLLSHAIVHPHADEQDPHWCLGLVDAPTTVAAVTEAARAACRTVLSSVTHGDCDRPKPALGAPCC